jgi:hypothetical protein
MYVEGGHEGIDTPVFRSRAIRTSGSYAQRNPATPRAYFHRWGGGMDVRTKTLRRRSRCGEQLRGAVRTVRSSAVTSMTSCMVRQPILVTLHGDRGEEGW